jgi:hypothetical protein
MDGFRRRVDEADDSQLIVIAQDVLGAVQSERQDLLARVPELEKIVGRLERGGHADSKTRDSLKAAVVKLRAEGKP